MYVFKQASIAIVDTLLFQDFCLCLWNCAHLFSHLQLHNTDITKSHWQDKLACPSVPHEHNEFSVVMSVSGLGNSDS